jgi:hypothetical protein
MSVALRGSLEACAQAGIEMFQFPELRATFCPTREDYFEPTADGTLRPRPTVFTGFDQILDAGKIVGLEMSKQMYFDAAVFIQVALKSQWQDSVLRREGRGADGRLIQPPRFGEEIGHCPTFLMADEAQDSATPQDARFKALCRSKRASVWEFTQSHSSVKDTFGAQKGAAAAAYFQNSMTKIYLRQSDQESMELIQKECGQKTVPRTTLAVTEGGSGSELSYVQGDIVHEGMGFSSTKTITPEKQPFVETDQLTQLPNNVAIVRPSNGDRPLPATVCYLRPLWVFKKFRELSITTPWEDWPPELRATYDLDNIPQELQWPGWSRESLDASAVVPPEARLGRFVQPQAGPPDDTRRSPESLEALSRLHIRMNQLPKAAEELRTRIAMGGPPRHLRFLRMQLAEICDRLNDTDGAIAAYAEILTASPQDTEALAGTERLLEVAERFEELQHVLQRRADIARGPERAALIRKRARLLRDQLDNAEAAKACLRQLEAGVIEVAALPQQPFDHEAPAPQQFPEHREEVPPEDPFDGYPDDLR